MSIPAQVRCVLLGVILMGAGYASASASLGKAPSWDISEWINSPGLTLDKLQGQVVIVEFFQFWCPGCNKFSIPLIKKWQKTFEQEISDERLTIVSIHTVFEGHAYLTVKRLRAFLIKKGIDHPVGVDRHEEGERIPETMKKYRTGGTPEMAIIGKKGRIRFQHFGYFEPEKAEALIRELLAE